MLLISLGCFFASCTFILFFVKHTIIIFEQVTHSFDDHIVYKPVILGGHQS